MTVTIYGLIDSAEPDAIRYVGKTVWTPERRLRRHVWQLAHGDATYKARWISSVLRAGRTVNAIAIAQAVTEDKGNQLERFHIARLRAEGAMLTNLTDGGDGLSGVTEETKQKMRAAKVGWTPSESLRIAASKRIRSADERQKIGDLHRGKTLSVSTRRKLSEWRTGKKFGPQSEESRRKKSEALKGRPKTSEHTAKVAAANTGLKRSDEYCRKLSQAKKEEWARRIDRRQSPDHKRKRQEAYARTMALRRAGVVEVSEWAS